MSPASWETGTLAWHSEFIKYLMDYREVLSPILSDTSELIIMHSD